MHCKVLLQAGVPLTVFEQKVLDEFQADVQRQHEHKWNEDEVLLAAQNFATAATYLRVEQSQVSSLLPSIDCCTSLLQL